MQQLRVEYLEPPEPVDEQVDRRQLGRRALQATGLLTVLALIVLFAPGLGEVRTRLGDASPGWLVAAVALEGLSCASYVVMFKPIFCDRMTWRSATELGLSELAIGSLVPASGAAGLALGAWALRKSGMPTRKIAERSVAFFVIKSGANFVAVAVLGVLMFLGLGPSLSPLLTILPAALAILAIAAVVLLPRVLHEPERLAQRGPKWAAFAKFVGASGDGLVQAGRVLRTGDARVISGSLGYWFFDNLVLWATFHAVGTTPPFTIVLMAYLIGQLGGLLPIPGGIGGIDGGLIGTFVVYGVAAAPTTAAVLAYRLILFWLPLLVGSIAFTSLQRGFNDPERPDLCGPIVSPVQPAAGG